jgi:hypothetical protein
MSSRDNVIGRLCAGWKRFVRKVDDFQARLLLSGFYFLVATRFALVLKVSGDPRSLVPKTPKGWRLRPASSGNALERARAQF